MACEWAHTIWSQIWRARVYQRSMSCQIRSETFILSSKTKENFKTPIFPCFQVRHPAAALPSIVEKKMNAGAPRKTFPYPIVSKPLLYSTTVASQTLSFEKCDNVTNKETKPPNFFTPHPGGTPRHSPTKLVMVIEVCTILAAL